MEKNETPEAFSLDLMQNERLRSRLLGVVSILIIIAFGFFAIFHYDLFQGDSTSNVYLFSGIALMIILAFRAFAVSHFVKIVYKRRKSIPLAFQLFNVFFEVSIPSIILYFFSLQVNPAIALNSAIALLYFIMIILTVMEMDMRISAFAGILSGVEFFTVSFYLVHDYSFTALPFIGEPVFYFGKSLIMVLSGFIAGYLAESIKKRALKFYLQQKEKAKVEQLFGQQLSPQIAQRLIQSRALIKPEVHEACIMFLDIRDFTRLTEKMPPEEIIRFQNHIFADMFQDVIDHNGLVNQVMGDGFMATFGAPLPLENACEQTLNCCKKILDRLPDTLVDERFPAVKIGIGLHFGPVVTGNIGSSQRMQFSITGQTVIIASRIEQLNKSLGTQLLFSGDVRQQLAERDAFYLDVGKHEMKGLSHPMQIYSIQPPDSKGVGA